jgi:hypothetical protein
MELCPETRQQLRFGKPYTRHCLLPLDHKGRHGLPSSHNQWDVEPKAIDQLFALNLISKADDMVYFMSMWNETVIKIGHSRDVKATQKAAGRFGGKTIILGALPGGAPLEKWFHEKFAHLRQDPKHEHFNIAPELIECIDVLFGDFL